MALSENTPRAYELGDVNSLPVKASSTIYVGSAVGLTSGYARALNAGDQFAGFALEKATGTSSDGGVRVNVRTKGLIQLSVASAAVTDIGKTVYASDDGTFTLDSDSGSNSAIGTIYRFVSAGVAVVQFDAMTGLSGVTVLTDNTGGTANNTLEDIGTLALDTSDTYSDAAVNAAVNAILAKVENNFADLAAKVNEIIRALR